MLPFPPQVPHHVEGVKGAVYPFLRQGPSHKVPLPKHLPGVVRTYRNSSIGYGSGMGAASTNTLERHIRYQYYTDLETIWGELTHRSQFKSGSWH